MKRLLILLVICAAFFYACNQDTNRTREKAADATTQLKEGAKKAGAELRKDTEEARKQGTAIAEGVREGWKEGDKAVDINAASKDQLMTLPGVRPQLADRIIAARPYNDKSELVSRKIVSPNEYRNIEDRITAKRTTPGQ
jgi:DNA uptake protein ComE-like DNA-binding protein